jgi:hypothetical protein
MFSFKLKQYARRSFGPSNAARQYDSLATLTMKLAGLVLSLAGTASLKF